MALPTDSKARKEIPVWSGCVTYFPDALVAVAQLSFAANEKHNPGEPLHWAKEKSTDEQDAGLRHAIEPLLIGGSEYDSEDGFAHKVKKAWRALAELQRFLEAGNAARAFTPGPGGIRIPIAGVCEYIRTAGGSEVRVCFACMKETGALAIADTPHVCGRRDIMVPRCCYVQPTDGMNDGQVCRLSDGHPGPHLFSPPEPREADTEAVPGLDKLIGPGEVVAGFTKVDGINCCAKCKCPLDRPAPETCTLKSQHQNPPVHCQQCGGELPRHFAGCLSHAANAGQ